METSLTHLISDSQSLESSSKCALKDSSLALVRLSQSETDIVGLVSEVETIRQSNEEIQKQLSVHQTKFCRLKRVETDVLEIKSDLTELKADVKTALNPLEFSSLIISDFPIILAEFHGKRFVLLWRGSRDGFGAKAFHDRCDGHSNTLTLILDTSGNIFGGFTPVAWESHKPWKAQADNSLKSFIFTLKNPHNVPARQFRLKAEAQNNAIICYQEEGPIFGGCGPDILIREKPATYFGTYYMNDTGLNGETFFAGAKDFTLKEIEVFEIIQ
jgi:hypothetical protein